MKKEWTIEESLEMPTPCQSCGKWQELTDMVGSDKWYPGTVICEECSDLEEKEIELDEEIENEENNLADAKWQIEESTKELEKLQVKKIELENKIEKQRYGN